MTMAVRTGPLFIREDAKLFVLRTDLPKLIRSMAMCTVSTPCLANRISRALPMETSLLVGNSRRGNPDVVAPVTGRVCLRR